MIKTYNTDNKWYWSKTSGPMPAIQHLKDTMEMVELKHQMDHLDRQKLDDGSWEYTWHPYTLMDSFEGSEYEPEIEALKGYGWTVTMTGTETSEYAQLHKATECFTRRVSMVRHSFEDRLALSRELATEIETLTAQIKANKKARHWDTWYEDQRKLTNLKRKKQIILFRY